MIFIASFFNEIYSQVTVEEEITTDTLDLFSSAKEYSKHTKSARIALWGNILLPGLGHQYLQKDRKAIIYFATEAIVIMGMIFNKGYSQNLYNDSKSYAWKYARTTSQKETDHNYWQIIGNKHFLSYKQYNNAVELNGEYSLKKTDPNELWVWESDRHQSKYRDIREKAVRFHVISSFFLGAMFVNRIVSFIDIRVTSKYQPIQSKLNKVKILPTCSFSEKKTGLVIINEF
jgi:hypothetical protein